MIKGYKIRIYPTKEQKQMIWSHINGCRFVWNYLIEQQKKAYEENKQYLSSYDMINIITKLKQIEEYSWIKNIPSGSLQKVCFNVNFAYQMFFKKVIPRTPTFKSKKNAKMSYPIRDDKRKLWFDENFVHVSLVGKIKYKTDLYIPLGMDKKFSCAQIVFRNNKYFICFCINCENQAIELSNLSMGIDLGIKETAVVSYGCNKFVYHNINKSKQMQNYKKKEKYYQRVLSRKYRKSYSVNGCYKKTNNINKTQEKINKIRNRIHNIRMNYIHQMTHSLIMLLPETVVMEDLSVRTLMKNKQIADKIRSQMFYTVINTMKYKCEHNNINFVLADRYFPSSKTCSSCGSIKRNLKLNDRIFICNECGLTIDRDYNAAINLSKYKT